MTKFNVKLISMGRLASFYSVLWLSLVGSAMAQTSSASLDECFQAAAQKSELVSDQSEQVVQADAQISQATGSLLPNLSGSAEYLVQQSPTDPVAASFFPSYQPTVRLKATQPLFRGLRDFATIRQLKRIKEAREFARDQALVQLYSDVVKNFYDVLSLEKELKNLEAQIGLYEDRIAELNRRARTGESSASDSLTAQATQATVKAQAKRIQGQYKTAREAFSFLTGLPQDTPLVSDDGFTLATLAGLDQFLGSIEARPDIRSAKQSFEAADESVLSAKGAHLPTADLVGNYYLVRPQGVFDSVRWDVQATLNVPLFSGGTVKAQVAEAASKRKQAELALSRTRRLADQEVKALYETYQTDLEEVAALQQARVLAEKNYLVLKQDYTRGLTRNIDVLAALAQFQESKRALDRSRLAAHSNWIRLNVLSAKQTVPSASNLAESKK